MKHCIFQENATYEVAILIKSSSFNKNELYNTYVASLESATTVIAFDLKYEDGKVTSTVAKDYLAKLLPVLDSLQVKYLYVADAAYFKSLTKVAKADVHIGYVLPCKVKGYEHMQVALGINYSQLIYNPTLQTKIDSGLSALVASIKGTYQDIGTGIIHSESYPDSPKTIAEALESLHQYSALTCDIEGFSLRFNEAGIGSIAFAWNQNNGLAFEVDCLETKKPKQSIRYLLRRFFETYKGSLTFHYAQYDVKAIIYNLWMRHPLDHEGMLLGLDVMCRDIHDTKIIAYLAVNSTAGNKLGLKELAQPFAGNYAVEEIKDITKVPKAELLRYNLVDVLSTWYVRDTYYPKMVADSQEQIYKELMIPSLKVLIQTEMVGMPMSDEKIAEAKAILVHKKEACLALINSDSNVLAFNHVLQKQLMDKANAKLKTKQHPIEKFAHEVFNPNSGPQLQSLLYELMALPVLDTTDTGLPATGGDVLKKLLNHANQQQKDLLTALVEYSEAEKILSTFIPTFEEGFLKADGIRYLHGSFNLGGTVSGRLSSSSPNLQNLPSNSSYGKTVKSCFVGSSDWLFCGADFNALESRINALLTKDPNKLKVFTDGYDSHCVNAAAYFKDQMPDIDPTNVASVNSVAKKYPELRQKSKTVTFAAQYGGTYITFMNTGFSLEEAKTIEKNYHELYKASDDWVAERIAEASKQGYATAAFGLRVRTPLLKQVMLGTSTVPSMATAEARSVGNAISGQSHGQLNNRATNAFMAKVWSSPYRLQILPVAEIHDATYFLIKNDLEVLEWANKHLIEEMEWQDLPEIQYPGVTLGAALDVFKLGWHKPITLPNRATQDEIKQLLS